MRADDVDRFLNASAARDHVFGDNEAFALVDLESAPQSESAGFFFDKDVAFAQRAPDFLADDDPAEGRGDHGVAIEVAQLICELLANLRRDPGVLKENGALEILAAVQAGAQNEMAVEQRAGFAKKREKVFAHLISSDGAL